METTTQCEDVIAFARSTHETLERVRYADFARYRDLYTATYRLLRGNDPFSITVRRAYNKSKAIAAHDEEVDIYAGVLILSFAADLDPSFDYLEIDV